ncbi:MAG: BMP family protein [Lactobacillus sp.]|nr:BMP family protein [Lactobacillus sp.]
MNKKILSALTISFAGLVLVGCGAKHKSSSSNSNTKGTVALITDDNGVDDHSFQQSAWTGFLAYGKEHNLKRGRGGYQYFQSNSAADFDPNITQAVNAGYKTVFGIGYMLTDAIKDAAKKNPKTNFVIVDDVITGVKNAASATFKSNESSYLAGIAAAYTTKTNTVGFIGGAKGTVISAFEAGYLKGVKDGAKQLGKKITVLDQYVGNFTSTDKAKSIAQSMYAKNADIIYQAAGGAGNGVFQEAKVLNQAQPANKKVWVIGVDIDQSSQGKYTAKGGEKSNFTLTSVLKEVGTAVKDIANDAYQGKFPGGKHLVFDLKNKGVSLTKGYLSDKAWNAAEKARQEIIDGKITVPTTVK